MTTKKTVASLRSVWEEKMLAHEQVLTEFSGTFPMLVNKVLYPVSDFRGFSMYPADRGGFLVVNKVFSSVNGEPLIMFSNGADPIDALMSMEHQLAKGDWRADKKAR